MDDDRQTVNLDEWDLGEVLAVVDKPKSFEDMGSANRTAAIVDAAEIAANFAAPTMPSLHLVPLVVLAFKAGQRTKSVGPEHVALIAIEDARKLASQNLLVFPEGGPMVGQVYGRHPLRRRDYLPYASYHRLVLHEKSIEAARYLLSLGARDVEITCQQAAGKSAKAEAGVKVPSVEDVSLTMGFGRDTNGQLAIRVTGAGKRRRVPGDLIWPGRDPMFKLAHDAAQAGAETFHFGLKAEQSGSVNARAAMTFEKELRLGLGGEYKRWEDLSLTVDARFGTAPA